DPDPVGDVELLQLDRLTALRPADIDAVVGEDAVDVEGDEADTAGELGRDPPRHRAPPAAQRLRDRRRRPRESRARSRGEAADDPDGACWYRPTARGPGPGEPRGTTRRRRPPRRRERAEGRTRGHLRSTRRRAPAAAPNAFHRRSPARRWPHAYGRR